MQFLRGANQDPSTQLTVSFLDKLDSENLKTMVELLSQWTDLPYQKIEIRSSQDRNAIELRLIRNCFDLFEIHAP